MTDTRERRIRSAVFEIVDRAPLAPTVDDLAGRSVPHSGRSRFLLPAIAVLVVAAAAALTSRLDDRVGTNPSTTVEPSTSLPPSSEVTATAAYRIVRESEAALGNLGTLAGPLIKTCMAAKGFTFTPNSTTLMSEQEQSAFVLRRYPGPRQQDGKWGYYFDSTDSATEDAQTPSANGEVGPGYFDAMQGKPIAEGVVLGVDGNVVSTNQVGDGCYGQAMAAMFGSEQAYVTFFTQVSQLEMITGQAYSDLHAGSDFLARNQPWAACMKNAGFAYQTIFDPQNRDWNSPRPATEEQQVAAADSQCRQGNHLDGADLLPLEEQILSDLLVAHPMGNSEELELQVQALTAGKFPAADNSSATTPASTTSG